jgi:hypothetical protein
MEVPGVVSRNFTGLTRLRVTAAYTAVLVTIVGVAGALIALSAWWVARRWGRRRIDEPLAVVTEPPKRGRSSWRAPAC